MAGADHSQKFHLATDASKWAVGGVLFQLDSPPTGIEVSPKHFENLRIVMFLSFRLADAETRYDTTERECLAVVRDFAEVRWLVVGNPYPVLLYTDHQALDSILTKGSDGHGRVARWQDRLGEYDFLV